MNQAMAYSKDTTPSPKTTVFLSILIGAFLAIAPVLDPYILFDVGSLTIHVNDIIAIFLTFFCFLKKQTFSRESGFFLTICCLFLFVTMIAFLGNHKGLSLGLSLRNLVFWFFYSFLMAYFWDRFDRKIFFKVLSIVSLACSVLVVLQFVAGYAGLPMWEGRIPFLPLSEYDQWSGYIDRATGDIRPCGFFQESSYVGIYGLVAYVYLIKNNKLWQAILVAFSAALTSSLLGIVGIVITTVYLLIFGKRMKIRTKTLFRFILILLIVLLFINLLITSFDSVNQTFQYVFGRFFRLESDITGERESSAQIRLIGSLPHFKNYEFWQKTFGVGASQFSVYLGTDPYSNNFVTILLDYGIFGFLGFVAILLLFLKKIGREQYGYFIVLLLVFASDRQFFNWYFFYLFTACYAFYPVNSGKESNTK